MLLKKYYQTNNSELNIILFKTILLLLVSKLRHHNKIYEKCEKAYEITQILTLRPFLPGGP